MRFVVSLVMTVLLVGCGSDDPPELDFLVETEPSAYDGVSIDPERIDELRREIEEQRDEVEELVAAMSRTASLEKQLAEEYLRQEMFEPALEALQRAMALQTENAILYNWAGVAAARSAKAHLDEQDRYFAMARHYYESALAIRPEFKDALYGLAVLLAFEFDAADEALPYITRLAEIETASIDVKFLHANILVRLERYDEAIEIYDNLSRTANSDRARQRAEENRDQLLRGALQ